MISEYFNHLVQKTKMSANTTSSLKDFELQLSFLGRNVLDEEAFNALLDNIGYKRSREGLFESLLNDVASAGVDSVEEKKALGSRRFVTVEDIAKMYGSDPYHIFDNGEDAGVSLMAYVDKSEYDQKFTRTFSPSYHVPNCSILLRKSCSTFSVSQER